MTDKFVVSTNEIGAIIVTDVETDKVYFYDTIYDFFGLIRLLNEQQATINKLQELVAEWGATLLMNGFEIEVNGKDLRELIKDE